MVAIVIRKMEYVRSGLEQNVALEEIAADREPTLGFGTQAGCIRFA